MFRGDDPELSRTIGRAWATARDLGHPRVGTEHLLLALATGGGAVADLLGAHGVTADAIREAARAAGPGGAAAAADREILAPLGVKVNDVLSSGPNAEIRPGNALPLRNIPAGTMVHAIELRPGGGAKMARAAGTAVQLMSKEGDMALLRLPSGEMRQVSLDCRATIGQVGNSEAELIKLGKAGRNRWKGVRPQTRGVAMNPIDHPLGGGEGKSSGGRHPVSPWGKPEGRTRSKKKASNKYIVRRRTKKGRR